MGRSSTTLADQQQAAALTFVIGACAVALALAGARAVQHLVPALNTPLSTQFLALLLVSAALYRVGSSRVPELRPLSSIGLVVRHSQWQELGTGAALGWGIAIALLLPALLTLHLQSFVRSDAYHWQQSVLGILLLLVNAAVTQLVFTGLLFRSLVRAASGTMATLCFSLLATGIAYFSHTADLWQLLFIALAQVIFSMAALRTRATWVSFGIQATWGVVLQVVFGVSSFYWPGVAGVVQSYVTGPRGLTGAYLGPEASLWALLVVLLALAVLWRTTRDFAWNYAYDPIEGAGYPMEVAPPKEHTRMEAEAAAQPPSLVQIAPAPGVSPGTDRHI